jgi:transposase
MSIILTPGQQHESTDFIPLMESGGVKCQGPGQPKLRPRRASADKGYSSKAIRQYLRRKGIRITIPHKKNEHQTGPFDRDVYRGRNCVERLINRLKQFRRLATRYEKLAANCRAMWLIGAILLALYFAGAP